nr:hypothetical protein [Tanacetum cinerariifolium]
IIRNIERGVCDGCEDRMVTCLPGAKVADVTSRLDRLVESAGEEVAVVVHVGTNDVGKCSRAVLEAKFSRAVLEAKFRLLGRKLKSRTPKVAFSEVLPVPRAGPARQAELRGLNAWMRHWCQEEGFRTEGCRDKGANMQPFLGDLVYKCFYANARSLRAKMGELECLVARENIDIVGITETWWNAENQWDTVIPGYKLYRRDREGRVGGGVAIYVKEGLESTRVELEGESDSSVESLWIRLLGSKSNVIVGACYRPPDQKPEGDLEMRKQIREVSTRDRVVVMGDFNYPHIDWVNSCSGHERETGFLDMLNDCALEQLVTEPTRGQVTLDLILCGTQDLVREVNVTEPLGNSDHAAICFAMHVGGRVPSKSDTKTLDFRRADFPKMRRLVKKKLKGKSAWRLFKTTVIEAQRECIPQRRKGSTKSRRVPAWLTSTVKEAIKGKEASFRKWKSCPNEENKQEHKLWQKKCKKMIWEA